MCSWVRIPFPTPFNSNSTELLSTNYAVFNNDVKNTTNSIVLAKKYYFKNREGFVSWLEKKSYSKGYYVSILHALDKLFKLNLETIDDFKNLIKQVKVPVKSSTVGFRVFLNFCEDESILNTQIIEDLRKNIKIVRPKKSNIDIYVPSTEEIKYSISRIKKEFSISHYIIFKLILETGMRYTETVKLIENFNENNVEVNEDKGICVYSNFYLRGHKKSFYLFFTIRTYELIKTHLSILKKITFNNLPKQISKQKDIISLKYLRKYQFNLLIENEVSFEVANFIQGRSSNDVGINHYLSKKKFAVDGYQKIISILNEFE